jgi:PadR family transcriptional regulator PadR
VPGRPDSTPQTRAVFVALHDQPARWRYGYELSRETGLASGTLYPILGRLSDRRLLETRWEETPQEGRPRRHLYRLSALGAARAAAVLAEPAARSRVAHPRIALEGT